MRKLIEDSKLLEIQASLNNPTSLELKDAIKKQENIDIDEATIRGRFIAMGKPLSGKADTGEVKPPTFIDTPDNNTWKKGKILKVLDTVDTIQDNDIDSPGLSADMRALKGRTFELDFVDNRGWVHMLDEGKAQKFVWKKEWVTEDLTPPAPKFLKTVPVKTFVVPTELHSFIPSETEFDWYVERDIDKRLAHHYDLGKHPITQGKQGTGKTAAHAYYAFKRSLPFFLFSAYEDFKLAKLFGDKTIQNGSVVFQESLFVKAIQGPSVVCIDECNAISQANTYDWHALLQNRQLFIKDADNGKGKIYKVHPDCHIGFAQNPKSAKYIGGNIRSSNFLGRCTYITFPEFTLPQLRKAISLRHKNLPKDVVDKFVKFYQGCIRAIEESQLPIDVSIRQLNNVIDLYIHGMDLREACEDGLASMAEAASQPKAKEALMLIAECVWVELMKK